MQHPAVSFGCGTLMLVAASLCLPFSYMFGHCNRMISGADAFVPPFPQTAGIFTEVHRKPTAFVMVGARKWSVSEIDPIRRQMAQQQQGGSDEDDTDIASRTATIGASNDGVPSSPLDRPILSSIDAMGLFVFAGIGKASHSAVDGSLDVAAVLVTAFPFLVSWFLVAPLVGSYTPQATSDTKSAAVQTARGWILAVPLGCVLRGIIKGYVPPIPFVVVTLLSTLVILTIGRVGYTFLSELYVEMF